MTIMTQREAVAADRERAARFIVRLPKPVLDEIAERRRQLARDGLVPARARWRSDAPSASFSRSICAAAGVEIVRAETYAEATCACPHAASSAVLSVRRIAQTWVPAWVASAISLAVSRGCSREAIVAIVRALDVGRAAESLDAWLRERRAISVIAAPDRAWTRALLAAAVAMIAWSPVVGVTALAALAVVTIVAAWRVVEE